MKSKIIFVLLLALCLFSAQTAPGAAVKISALPATTTLTPQSLIEVSYWNGSSFVSRKMTYTQLGAQLGTNTTALSTNALFANDTTLQIRSTGRAPQPVIVVADYSSDVGENAGLKQRLAMMDQGQIKIIAYITSLTNEYSAACLAHTLSKYGYPDIPVGVSRTNYYSVVANVTNSVFNSGVPLMLYNSNYPSATDVLRNVLSHQPDNSVVVDWEGDMGPLFDLSLTTADTYSPLDGLGLLGRKTFYHLINAGDTNNYDFLETFTASAATNTLTHAVLTNSLNGQTVRVIANGGTLPGGVSAATDYYLIVVTSTTSKLATTYSNAINAVAIDLTSDSTGSPQLQDYLQDHQNNGDFNLHAGASFGPPLINGLTNKIVWLWNKIPMFYPPTTTDPLQMMWVGQNLNNPSVHPAWMPMYQDATNYLHIYGGTTAQKPPWDAMAALFTGALPSGFGTNWHDGTRMFDLSAVGKATVSAAFPGHIFWTNNASGAGGGVSNHFYLTLAAGFRNQITNLANSMIDAPPSRSGADYRKSPEHTSVRSVTTTNAAFLGDAFLTNSILLPVNTSPTKVTLASVGNVDTGWNNFDNNHWDYFSDGASVLRVGGTGVTRYMIYAGWTYTGHASGAIGSAVDVSFGRLSEGWYGIGNGSPISTNMAFRNLKVQTLQATNVTLLSYTVAPPVIPTGSDGVHWNSNKVMYWVTSTKTNLVSDGR